MSVLPPPDHVAGGKTDMSAKKELRTPRPWLLKVRDPIIIQSNLNSFNLSQFPSIQSSEEKLNRKLTG